MLSKSQQRAEKVFRDFLDDPTQHEMVIAGFAGSGKSYLIKYLINVLDTYNKTQLAIMPNDPITMPHFTATTNKAAAVLGDMLNYSRPTQTIHSLLGLKVKNDYNKGTTYLESTDRTKEMEGVVIFIDEASMIERKLYSIIKQLTSKCKVVYIGDDYQLPPVFEKNSIVFKNPNTIHLKEIQRQAAHNPVIQLSQKYRTILDKGLPFTWPEVQGDNRHEITDIFTRLLEMNLKIWSGLVTLASMSLTTTGFWPTPIGK